MAEKQDVRQSAPIFCANGCGFFGSATTNNLCSVCYKDMINKAAAPVEAAAEEKAAAPVEAATEEKATAIKPESSSSSNYKTAVAPPVPAAAVVEEQREEEEAPVAVLCVRGCGFFGSAKTMNMCSKCYADSITTVDATPVLLEKIQADKAALAATEELPVPAAEEAAPAVEPPKAAPNRCQSCRKKVGLLGFACRCGGTFCSLHRYPEKHACEIDYKTAEREQLAKNNPLVMASKINKI